MPYPWRKYPILEARHIARDAKLYAHRNDMAAEIGARFHGGIVAEVGVAFGDFSDVLLSATEPSEFIAIDLFTMHTWPAIWGKAPAETIGNKTHLQFYRDRFQDRPVRAIQGDFAESLRSFPDAYFDLIYIDADHAYDAVVRDAHEAHSKLASNGVLIFNDYIMFDHAADLPYGVVQSVNQLIVEKEYEVIGFALEHNMFCDVALRRAGGPK